MEVAAQGWYHDPYARHEDRYFSGGVPTKLVRDFGREAYDPPPDLPLPDCQLIPVVGSDAADDSGPEAPSIGEKMKRAVLDLFDQLPKQ